jgi:tartrate dehydrogenase/decarboxylase/D-malate dehydrogenase
VRFEFTEFPWSLAGAITGSIGIAPAANLNPERRFPSMFEPVHGSAPDIAGLGIANPIGRIWTSKLLLDLFGMDDVGAELFAAIRGVVRDGIVTPDLGGSASTGDVTDASLTDSTASPPSERRPQVNKRPCYSASLRCSRRDIPSFA